jgi:hypothetical protein
MDFLQQDRGLEILNTVHCARGNALPDQLLRKRMGMFQQEARIAAKRVVAAELTAGTATSSRRTKSLDLMDILFTEDIPIQGSSGLRRKLPAQRAGEESRGAFPVSGNGVNSFASGLRPSVLRTRSV